jgi:hypothetical protein
MVQYRVGVEWARRNLCDLVAVTLAAQTHLWPSSSLDADLTTALGKSVVNSKAGYWPTIPIELKTLGLQRLYQLALYMEDLPSAEPWLKTVIG